MQPAVLEQLRLLTNLETNTKKLLQVILIGQPELQQLLQRQDLRQLAQRITARYHLMPLTLAEVQYYVQHRLQVAGWSPPGLYRSGAENCSHLSGGIPRLVNLICDRALLGGYSQQKALIDAPLVQQAAGEILAIRQPDAVPARPWWLWPLLGFCVFVMYWGGRVGYAAAAPERSLRLCRY